jgi:hypothetical protein
MSSRASAGLVSHAGTMSAAISRHFFRLREPKTNTIDALFNS